MNTDRWTEGTVVVGGVSIHYHRTGSGGQPSLVLAHGLSDSGLCWRRTARALADEFDVVMFDARNHGRSDRAAGAARAQADDAAGLIRQLGLDRPAIVGHSMGGSSMALLAAHHPALVSRAVLEDPPWRDGPSELSAAERDEIQAWLRSFGPLSAAEIVEMGHADHPDWDDAEYPDWADAKRHVDELAAGGLDAPPWPTTVADIACPTLLIHGDVDRGGIVSPAVAQQATELNGLISTRLIHDAGHNIRRENFDDYIAAVREFLTATA